MGIEGIIRPPPEIRAVADKTASYVAKNGRAFESRILGSGKGKTPKFSFLQPTSPFHAYYESKIQFYEQGGIDGNDNDNNNNDDKDADKKDDKKKKQENDKENETQDTDNNKTKNGISKNDKTSSQKSRAAIDPVAKALLMQRTKIHQARTEFQEQIAKEQKQQQQQQQPEAVPPVTEDGTVPAPPPPPPETTTIRAHYTPPPPATKLELPQIVAPSSLSIAQVEIIQLAAQMTALDGNKAGPFYSALVRREWSNPNYQFLQARHGHFAYFSALVDAYRTILATWSNHAGASGAANPPNTSNNNKYNNENIQDRANNPQKCLEMAAYRVEYERDLVEEQARYNKEIAGGDPIATMVHIDWHDFVVVETIDFPVDEKVELAMLPPPPLPITTTAKGTTTTTTTTETMAKKGSTNNKALSGDLLAAGVSGTGMEESDDDYDDEEEEETIRVVPSYTPRVVAASDANVMDEVIDPITGKSVRVADMPEHMRIQLLDPKWAEERARFQEKQKDSNLVSGDDIASNISRLNRDQSGTTVRLLFCFLPLVVAIIIHDSSNL